ncbi:MAG: glycosyltransferase [Alistipes sp.]
MKLINLFFAINDNYAQHCCVAITSILENNRNLSFDIYLLIDSFSERNRRNFDRLISRYKHCNLHYYRVDTSVFASFSLTIDHISRETYYRYAIAELFPQLDKALYLDADLVVNGSVEKLWDTDLTDYLCAGVSDLWIHNIHYKPEIGFGQNELYINAGVLLLNLEAMRREKLYDQLSAVTHALKDQIRFQDQDVINIVCRGRIKELAECYNFTSANAEKHPQQRAEAIVIHYTGDVKPWSLRSCRNPLRGVYFSYLAKTPYRSAKYVHSLRRALRHITPHCLCSKPTGAKPLRVALIIDEFFGGAGTAYGGYGFLARHYIAKYIPCDNIQIEVLLGRRDKSHKEIKTTVDGVAVYTLPGWRFVARWLQKKSYDLYLSIEMTSDLLQYEPRATPPLLLWVQDPRPWPDWQEIQTVKMFPERCYWNTQIYEMVHRLYEQGRVTFVTQGHYLADKARILYRLPAQTPIPYLPNPIDTDPDFEVDTYCKKNAIIFIGRIESVKRGWLFCEIAKRMPEYEFYMLGQATREKDQNDSVMAQYRSGIDNLHFTGHLEGAAKFQYIKDAKILVNTSIHEALPVTFLEALAYGTLLVSCQNPDDLTARFGSYVGPVLGDGFEKVDLFVDAIRGLMNDEARRKERSVAACQYVKRVHNVDDFIRNMRALIREQVARSV